MNGPRIIVKRLQDDDVNYYEWAGTSLMSKPTIGCTGSKFEEVDTGDVYAFNEVTGEWGLLCELGGPVSSGSGGT